MAQPKLAAGLKALAQLMYGVQDQRNLRYTRERQQQQDALERDKVTADIDYRNRSIDVDEAQLARAEAGDKERAFLNRQRFLGNMAENYPGTRVSPATAADFRTHGMETALEPGMTLPSRQFVNTIQGSGDDTKLGPGSSVQSPAAETGEYTLRPTASERLRATQARLMETARQGDLNRASAMAREQLRVSTRSNDDRLRLQLQANALELQRYGINVRNEADIRRMMQQAAYQSAMMEDREWDNRVSSGIGGVLALLGMGAGPMPTPPDLSMPNYFAVPGQASGSSGLLAPGSGLAGLGDWDVVPFQP